jgi:AcrR family transcriptional regulator
MPPRLVPQDELIHLLRQAFREFGYEGATIAKLSAATGLGKSSLYHHFPGGKEQMATAVLDHVSAWFKEKVFMPLRRDAEPRQCLDGMIEPLEDFYRGGAESCLAGALALGEARAQFKEQIRAIFEGWIEEVASLLRRTGFDETEARRRAEDAVIRVEGALLVSRGVGDTDLFLAAVRRIPLDLLRDLPVRTAEFEGRQAHLRWAGG